MFVIVLQYIYIYINQIYSTNFLYNMEQIEIIRDYKKFSVQHGTNGIGVIVLI